ncbi:MAG: hypothetical protein ACE5J2_08740 [Nitrososphaerales archaeon]
MAKIKTTIATVTLLLLGTFAVTQNIQTDVFAEEIGEEKPVTGEETSFTLVLEPTPSTVNSGDIVNFTGRLSSNDSDISGKTVIVKDYDLGGIDNILGSRLTDSKGEFVIPWTAKRTDSRDNTVEVFAEFKDYPDYGVAKSSQYVITVKGW